MLEYEIANVLGDIWAKNSVTNLIPGRLGVDGGTVEAIDVTGRPGYVVVSKGDNGDQGITIAKNAVGAAKVVFQAIWMRRELGELVIDRASAYAGGDGGGGGSSTLAGLTDVQLTSPASGNALQYNGTKWINVVPAGGAGGAPSPHNINGNIDGHHEGLLLWDNIDFSSGSSITDLTDHAHGSLSGITSDQHHTRQHNIISGDTNGLVHTVAGVANQVVGLTATNTLGLLTASADPGATESLLKTDASGSLALDTTLFVVNGINDTVSMDAPLFVVDAAADIVRVDTTLLVANASTSRVSIDNPLFVVDAPSRKISVDDPFFVVNSGIGKVSIGNTLMEATTFGNSVAFDTDLLLINASMDSVSIKNGFFVADYANRLITIDTNLLYVDTTNNRIGINRIPETPLGGAAALDVIAANPGDITQRLKQIENQTQRIWRVENYLGDELIVMDSIGNLQSGNPGYVSGMTGWQITPGGNAEFNNIWARGELHATVFVKDEIHATGGTLLVATAGKLYSDAIIDASTTDIEDLIIESAALGWTPGQEGVPLTIQTTSPLFIGTTLQVQSIGNRIEIEDPPSGPGLYFQPGEILRVKTEINEEGNSLRLSDLWLEVMDGTQRAGYSSYSVIKRSGSDCTIPAGTAIVSYGQRGDGRILMTSDWRTDVGYSPYIDVFTTGASPWDADDPTAIIPRMRMGQLKGVGVPGTTIPGPGDGILGVTGESQYGIIAGSDLSDANSGYFIASNLGIRLYKTEISLNDGTNTTGRWQPNGDLRLGKNIHQDLLTGFHFDPNTGDVWIGNSSSESLYYLKWEQASGKLIVKGELTVSAGGSGFVTVGDMNTAITSSKTEMAKYTNDRRILRVTGTWNSSGNNIIQWGTTAGGANIEIFFYDGTKRPVVTGQTAAMTKRKYLFIDLDVIAPTAFSFIASDDTQLNKPNYVLIAICDPGPSGSKASVNVVAGGVYIGGGNIFAQSIQATNIKGGTITANEISTNTITSDRMATVEFYSHLTTNYIDPKTSTAQTNAETYSNRRRVVGVGGTPGIEPHPTQNSNMVRWTGLTVRFASGNTTTVTSSTGVTLSATANTRTYFYIDIGTGVPPASVAMQTPTTNIADMGANDVLLFVAESMVNTSANGSGYPTINIVAGGTYISGDAIITNSIVAQNIAASAITAGKIDAGAVDTLQLAAFAVTAAKIDALAVTAGKIDAGAVDTNQLAAFAVTAAKIDVDAVTADKINVTNLSSINSSTGVLVIQTAGNIHSQGKDSYASHLGTAGFFLGSESSLYKFAIGDNASYLRWDGDELFLRTKTPITIVGDSANTLFNFTTSTSPVQTGNVKLAQDTGTGRPVFTWSGAIETFDYIEAKNLIVTGVGSNTYEVFRVNANATTGVMNYNYIGRVLNWDSDFNAAGTLYGNGLVIHANTIRIDTARTPTSGGAGVAGDFCWDGTRLYICVTANTWRSVNTQPL